MSLRSGGYLGTKLLCKPVRAVLWKVPLSVHHQWHKTKLCTQPRMWAKPQTLSHMPGLQPITRLWAIASLSAGLSLYLSVSRSRSTSVSPLCSAVTADRLCLGKSVFVRCVPALSAEACVIYNHLELLEVSLWMFIFLLCPITLCTKQKTKHSILHTDLCGGNSAYTSALIQPFVFTPFPQGNN